MMNFFDVPLRVRDGVHQAGFRGPNRFDGGLDSVLKKPIAAHGQCFGGALHLHIVIRLGPADRTWHHQQIRAANRLRKRNFAS